MFNWLINFFKVKNVEYPTTKIEPETKPEESKPEIKELHLTATVQPVDNTSSFQGFPKSEPTKKSTNTRKPSGKPVNKPKGRPKKKPL